MSGDVDMSVDAIRERARWYVGQARDDMDLLCDLLATVKATVAQLDAEWTRAKAERDEAVVRAGKAEVWLLQRTEERDEARATVERVRALTGQWERVFDLMNPESVRFHKYAAKTLARALDGADQ